MSEVSMEMHKIEINNWQQGPFCGKSSWKVFWNVRTSSVHRELNNISTHEYIKIGAEVQQQNEWICFKGGKQWLNIVWTQPLLANTSTTSTPRYFQQLKLIFWKLSFEQPRVQIPRIMAIMYRSFGRIT